MTPRELQDWVEYVIKSARTDLAKTIAVGIIVALGLIAWGFLSKVGENIAPFSASESDAPAESSPAPSVETAKTPAPTASTPGSDSAPEGAHLKPGARQPSQADTRGARGPQPSPGGPMTPEPPAAQLRPSLEGLIRTKEGRIKEVTVRLDRDRDEIDRQALAATERFTLLSRKGKLTPNERRQLAAEEAAMKRSSEIIRGLDDIKREFLRLAPQHIEALRSDKQDGFADDLNRQIVEQLHDRYLQLMSLNVGYDSERPKGVAPPNYQNQFEHVTLDVLKLSRQPSPETLFEVTPEQSQ
jgi:hypothetical protein